MSQTNKRAVVTFASHNKANYMKGLARLSESLRNNFDGDLVAFTSESSIGAPKHEDNPYAFKIYAIDKAIEAGYTQILWLDCSCFAVAPIDPIFEVIELQGYIMQDAGHYIGEWTNETTLAEFDVTRDEAMAMKCYGNAGFLGLSMEHDKGKTFFSAWKYYMKRGLFKGKWNNDEKTESIDPRCKGHRHDLSVGSLLAHRFGMKYVPGNEVLQYAGPYDAIANETILIKAQGL